MKKILIPFVASLGLSMGIATGVVMMRAPKAVPVTLVGKSPAAPTKAAIGGVDSAAAARADSPTKTTEPSVVAPDSTAATALASHNSAAGIGATVNATSLPAGVATSPQSLATTVTGQSVANAKLANSNAPSSPAIKAVVVRPPVSDSLVGRRLAQVFGAMQAKDAARVLQQMDDNDVRAILGSLSSKQQAAILGSFPTQRAALILQATLRTASAGGVE